MSIVLMTHPNGTTKRWVPERKVPQFEAGGWRRPRKPRKNVPASSEASNAEEGST